jgi:hypothetical protein
MHEIKIEKVIDRGSFFQVEGFDPACKCGMGLSFTKERIKGVVPRVGQTLKLYLQDSCCSQIVGADLDGVELFRD